MAAGRHGGYRDNDFRELDADIEFVRKRFGYQKEDYDQLRNGDRNYDGEGQIRGRGRVRQKDIKERGVVNGRVRSTSRSDSGSSGGASSSGAGDLLKRSGHAFRAADREPGELSSESGSDGALESEAPVRDSEVKKLENGNKESLFQVKKRKFSPIIWDRDDKEVSRIVKNRSSPTASTLPPLPPVNSSYCRSPNFDNVVNPSTSNDIRIQSSGPSPATGNLPASSQTSTASESPKELLSYPPEEDEHLHDNLRAEILDDDDYTSTRNIRSSRWANDADSPADEGEISADEEVPNFRKKKSSNESSGTRGLRKSLTPELGELKREGSEGNRGTRSSDEHIRSSSRDSYADDFDKNDYMEIDEDRNYDRTSASRSDSELEGETNSHGTPEPVVPPTRSLNMLQGCRSVDEFERLNRIDEGTYGVVYRARDKKTGEIVALKKVKMEKEREGFPLTSLREINILLSFHHPSIVDVKEVVVGSSLDSIFMVMEYMEHDLKALMETMKQPFSQSEVKCLMLQLLEGVKYLHDNWVLHRDLKTSNLLLNNQGELKICDFGLARQYGSPLKPYTHLVVTLWYRAPELLFGAKQYSTAIDMWSLGCIMAELLSKEPLFNGKNEFDQLDKIFRILGTPNETIWPGFSKLPGVKMNYVKHQYNMLRKKFPATSFTGSPVLSDAGFDLLNRLLTYDPEKRITAEAALNHEWFREVPLPKSKEFMPTFPAQHAQDRRMRRVLKSPDPLEEQRRKELKQGELGTGGLFG